MKTIVFVVLLWEFENIVITKQVAKLKKGVCVRFRDQHFELATTLDFLFTFAKLKTFLNKIYFFKASFCYLKEKHESLT